MSRRPKKYYPPGYHTPDYASQNPYTLGNYTPIPNISSYLIRGSPGGRNNNDDDDNPCRPLRYTGHASVNNNAGQSRPPPTNGAHDNLFRFDPNRPPSRRPHVFSRPLTREDFLNVGHPSPPPSPPLRGRAGDDQGHQRAPPAGAPPQTDGNEGDGNAAPPPGTGNGGDNDGGNGTDNDSDSANDSANPAAAAADPPRDYLIIFISPTVTQWAIVGVVVEFAVAAIGYHIGGWAERRDVVALGYQVLGVVSDVCLNGHFYVVVWSGLPVGVGGCLRDFWAVCFWVNLAVDLLVWMS